MEPIIIITVLLVISIVANFRSWFGRGGGRIPLPGGGSVNVTRRELNEIFREMTPEEDREMSAASRAGNQDRAGEILSTVALRYLQKKGRR